MQLGHDWRAFQTTFFPNDGTHSAQLGSRLATGSTDHPIYLIVEEDRVLSQYSRREGLKSFHGWALADVKREMGAHSLEVLQRRDVDQWISDSKDYRHFYDQKIFLRQSASKLLQNRQLSRSLAEDHFLLKALKGWWRRFLPSSYGIFIRTEGNVQRDFLLVLRLGTFDVFHEPDLSTLKDRVRQPNEVIRYLAEKHMVPVQGLFLSSTDWERWSRISDPWKQISSALWSGRLRLTPNPLGLRILVTLRAWFGI